MITAPEISPDARVTCRHFVTGTDVHVGPGAILDCDELVLADNCVIEPRATITGRRIVLGAGTRVGAETSIQVVDQLELGPACTLGPRNTWQVRHAAIGRELWTGPDVRIGGGSWNEVHSRLTAGYWLHLGMRVFINTARAVTIGNEVGLGTGTAVYTHGAYQSALQGFPVAFAPVTIGDNCWLPGAVVNPGVRIGENAVVAVGSVVTRDIPAGALAAGVPCRVIRHNAYPCPLTADRRQDFFTTFLNAAAEIIADRTGTPAVFDARKMTIVSPAVTIEYSNQNITVWTPQGEPVTTFALAERTIVGKADALTEKLRDLLRRHGIRFFAETRDGRYHDWRNDHE